MLSSKGVTLKPFSISYAVNAEDVIMNIMISEAAAHFDYWQRSGQDAQNVRQDYWPPLLRMARLIPAVEYIQVPARPPENEAALPCLSTPHRDSFRDQPRWKQWSEVDAVMQPI